MTKPLTETQRAILRNAAAHRDGPAAPPASLPPAPRIAVGKALLGAGLLARVGGSEGTDPGLGWKLDGAAVLLRITGGGLRAIGAALVPASPELRQCSVAKPARQPSAAAQEGTQAAAEPPDTARRRPRRVRRRAGRPERPGSADNAPDGEPAGLAAAIEGSGRVGRGGEPARRGHHAACHRRRKPGETRQLIVHGPRQMGTSASRGPIDLRQSNGR
jgi:hypothetical protein